MVDVQNESLTEGMPTVLDPDVRSSYDSVITCFTSLTARMLNCKRSLVTLVSGERVYVLAECTKTLSIASPHTYEPDDGLWLGGGTVLPSPDSLCEHTVSLVPESDEDYILEIPDLSKHPRYHDKEFVVNYPRNRFYGAVPLRTPNGASIGTLCVMDDKPRPDGFTPDERAVLISMGEVVMNYLQKKQGDRDMRKAKMMEMGLSRFIAEGFMPGEGAGMTERRDGRIWSEEALEQRRIKEKERIARVEEKRHRFQSMRFAEMMRERDKEWEREQGMNQQQDGYVGFRSPQSSEAATSPGEGIAMQRRPTISVYGPDSQIGQDIGDCESTISLLDTAIMNFEGARAPALSYQPSTAGSELLTPPTSADSAFNFDPNSPDDPISPEGTSTNYETSSPLQERRSEYESTTSREPHFRGMFSRAANLIRESLDADVVFLDGDLEGVFGVEDCNGITCCGQPHSSHISTNHRFEAAARLIRPKCCRKRSGILGYATARGSSSPSNEPSAFQATSDALGFDVSELNEDDIDQLVEENIEGRVVTHADGYNQDETPRSGLKTEEILKRFLPAAKSVILVPMFDHSRKAFAVCFA